MKSSIGVQIMIDVKCENMDKMCAFLVFVADWIAGNKDLPLIFAACHKVRSITQPRPLLGFLFQATGEFDWWEISGKRYSLPNNHLHISCTDKELRSAPVNGTVELWAVTFCLKNASNEFCDYLNKIHFPSIPVQNPSLLVQAFKNTSLYFVRKNATSHLRLKAALLDLLASVLDEVHGVTHSPGKSTPPTIERALDLMYRNISNPDLSLSDLAQAANINLHHFGRVFRNYFHVSPMKYFRALRVEHSRKLLKNTSLRVSEIAWQAGFSDPLYFSRIFHQQNGMGPESLS